ncbi:MAG: hypothetical protein M1438_17210 [Deltaproteobacteria bacterium]|nr:hypothetical protein [Deltaproteobacteria bacterium]
MFVLGSENIVNDEEEKRTKTILNYSQRFRISWAIIWPHFVILGAIILVIGLLASMTTKDKVSFFLPTVFMLVFMLFPPIVLTPWAVRRAVIRSYQGFNLQVERTNDQTKPLTRTDWMAPAWLWLWRNWVAVLILSPLTRIEILAAIPALVSFFVISPWVVGKMIEKKYATTLCFSVQAN